MKCWRGRWNKRKRGWAEGFSQGVSNWEGTLGRMENKWGIQEGSRRVEVVWAETLELGRVERGIEAIKVEKELGDGRGIARLGQFKADGLGLARRQWERGAHGEGRIGIAQEGVAKEVVSEREEAVWADTLEPDIVEIGLEAGRGEGELGEGKECAPLERLYALRIFWVARSCSTIMRRHASSWAAINCKKALR